MKEICHFAVRGYLILVAIDSDTCRSFSISITPWPHSSLHLSDCIYYVTFSRKRPAGKKNKKIQYINWIGQEANLNKFSILFSKNTDNMAIKGLFGYKDMAKGSVYLGNTLLLSRNKSLDFKTLRDRVSLRLEG